MCSKFFICIALANFKPDIASSKEGERFLSSASTHFLEMQDISNVLYRSLSSSHSDGVICDYDLGGLEYFGEALLPPADLYIS